MRKLRQFELGRFEQEYCQDEFRRSYFAAPEIGVLEAPIDGDAQRRSGRPPFVDADVDQVATDRLGGLAGFSVPP